MKTKKYVAPAIRIKEMASEEFMANSINRVTGDANVSRHTGAGSVPTTAESKPYYSVWDDASEPAE